MEKAADENYEKSKRAAAGETDEADATPKERHERLFNAIEAAKAVFNTNDSNAPIPLEAPLDPSLLGANDNNEKLQNAEAQTEKERSAMERAEAAYLSAYTRAYAEKKQKTELESESFLQLEHELNASRIEYANALTESASKRLLQKYPRRRAGQSERVLGKHREEVLERYNRLVRYKEIVKPFAEHRYQARIEAIASREKGAVTRIFGTALQWAAAKNAALENRIGKTPARIARAVATTAIAGTAGVLTGAFASIGLLGVAGWASLRVGRAVANSLAATGIGATAGEAAGFLLNRGKKRADKQLAYIGRTEGVLEIEDLIRFDEDRMKLQGKVDEAAIHRKKAIVRTLAAFAGGAGASILEGLYLRPSVPHQEAPHSAPVHEPRTPRHPQLPVHERAHESSPAPQHASTAHAESAEREPAHTTHHEAKPLGHIGSEVIDRGEYAGPFKNVITLPQGMNPESPEAVAYLNHAYNAQVLEHGGAGAEPGAEPTPEAPVDAQAATPEHPAAPEAAPTEAPHAEAHHAPVEHAASAATEAPASEPSIPEHSATAPEHASDSQPSAPGEAAIVNPHGVPVDLKAAHIYESTATKDYLVIEGGSNEQKDALINAFYADPKNETKVLMYVSSQKSWLTGQNRVALYTSAGVQINSFGRFNPLRPPSVDTFNRIIK